MVIEFVTSEGILLNNVDFAWLRSYGAKNTP